jgi:hypothetical protein
MTILGLTKNIRLFVDCLMKKSSIFSAISKSAITPSRMGLIVNTSAGVLPNISLARVPTASTFPFCLLTTTIEGSWTTIPFPLRKTKVFAVPRSIARSQSNLSLREFIKLISIPFFVQLLFSTISLQTQTKKRADKNPSFRDGQNSSGVSGKIGLGVKKTVCSGFWIQKHASFAPAWQKMLGFRLRSPLLLGEEPCPLSLQTVFFTHKPSQSMGTDFAGAKSACFRYTQPDQNTCIEDASKKQNEYYLFHDGVKS